jgi:hypothetical protein
MSMVEETQEPPESETGDTDDPMVPAELIEVYEINEWRKAMGEDPL